MTTIIIIAAMIAGLVIFYFVKKKKLPFASPKPPPPVIPPSPSDWRPMLGEAIPGPVKRTPRYGIQYAANGFDVVKPKQIDKTVQWLIDQGAHHLTSAFIEAANEVEDLPKWIDDAYEASVQRYQACGGKYAEFIAKDDPRTIFVEVIATPMEFAPGKFAGGQAYHDKKTVRVVIMTLGGMKDDPSTIVIESPATAHLALGKGYLPWEIGNLHMLRYGYIPPTIKAEWGDQSPCA